MFSIYVGGGGYNPRLIPKNFVDPPPKFAPGGDEIARVDDFDMPSIIATGRSHLSFEPKFVLSENRLYILKTILYVLIFCLQINPGLVLDL